jgi:predicted phage-related endonuclease
MAERLQNDDSLPVRLISVLQESLARAKAHAQYIEQRFAADEAHSGRRRFLAALINVAQIERKIAEFDDQAKALENAIQAEADRTVAKGKIERRDDLIRGIDALKRQFAQAKAAVDRARPAAVDEPRVIEV